MKPIIFTLRQEPQQRLDLSPLTPDRLVRRSAKEIEFIEIGTTRISVKVGDVFKLRLGEATSLRYEGGSERFDLIGAKLLPGFEIHVEGDVGAQVGRRATGGAITVAGDAGAYAASQLAGANIDIYGDAGDFLGAPLAGEIPGISGGRVVVRGSVGARAGDRLPRGVIIVEGDAGEDFACRMIAGTIILLGAADGRIGYLEQARHCRLERGARFRPDLCRLRRAFPQFCASLRQESHRCQRRSLAGARQEATTLRRRHRDFRQGRDIDPGVSSATLRQKALCERVRM